MKTLIITNLFPNNKEPNRAVFNKQQFWALSELCELKVVAPVPFFKYRVTEVPLSETIDSLDVYHPRYLVIPKSLRSLYGLFFFLGTVGTVKNIYRSFKFDNILATWAYPDAFGAALIARILKKPLVIKVHGSDINITSKYFLRRKMIQFAFRQAHKIIAVSKALKQKIIDMGVPEEKVILIPNGVDTNLFHPMEKEACRIKLALPLDKKLIFFVGNLEMIKGIDILVEAMAQIKERAELVIVGEGRLKKYLQERINTLGLKDCIRFLGAKAHDQVPECINAADVFCLPSRNEGCPNVILEALACRIPVVATKVGAIPEIIPDADYGILTEPGDARMLARSIQKALNKDWNKTSPKITIPDWKSTAEKVFETLQHAHCQDLEHIQISFSAKNLIKEILQLTFPDKRFLYRGDRKNRRVALTFDDGPHPVFTPKILDILRKFEMKATFFCVGQAMERYPDLTRRIVEENHYLGNHTYHHHNFQNLKKKDALSEIEMTSKIIQNFQNNHLPLFRPPQGHLSMQLLFLIIKHKLKIIFWNIDSEDWRKDSKELIVERVNPQAIKNGDILLFHDDNHFTVEALPAIIQQLRNRGLNFVTVDKFLNDEAKRC